jgi:hypothetical protein
MRRRVGTVVVTELTVVTLIHQAVVILRAELGQIPVLRVDPIEEGIE